MTSLCPGPLFYTPGFNHLSTPNSPTATPDQIESRLQRVPFNGKPWPKASPVARVYDVKNSTTQMILLNNRKPKHNRLRGQTESGGDISKPDPNRHTADQPYVNRDSHVECLNSTTPVFQPEFNVNLGWVNTRQRPPLRFEDGNYVNYKRHTCCMPSNDEMILRWHHRRPNSHASMPETFRSSSPMTDDLTIGEKHYLYSIARVYSVNNLRQLNQDRYSQLLYREHRRGNYSDKEITKYQRYIMGTRKKHGGMSNSGTPSRRIWSAPPASTQCMERGTERHHAEDQRSDTVNGKRRGSPRHVSWPISRISTVSNRSKDGKKKHSRKKSPSPKPSQEKNEKEQTKVVIVTPITGTESEDNTARSDLGTRQQGEKNKDLANDTGNKNDTEGNNTSKNTKGTKKKELTSDSRQSDEMPTKKKWEVTLHTPREGHGRPKSRLGRISKRRDSNNSDDDYDTDDTSSSGSDTERGKDKKHKKIGSKSEGADEKEIKKTPQLARPNSNNKSGKVVHRKSPSPENVTSYSDDFTSTSQTYTELPSSESQPSTLSKSQDTTLSKSQDTTESTSKLTTSQSKTEDWSTSQNLTDDILKGDEQKDENVNGNNQDRQRRDSIELDGDGRAKDVDKIEY